MVDKPINSLEELATLTQREFLAIGERFGGLEHKVDRLDQKVNTVVDTLDLMRADLHDIKLALGPLVRSVASLEEMVRHLDKRVVRLEEQATFR
jgi:hypothetical protein